MSHRQIFLAALFAVFVFHVAAAQTADGSGVSGRISQAPISPGPERLTHDEAAPLVNVRVQLRNAKLHIVAEAKTDNDGRFAMRAPPDAYTLLVDIKAKLPRCEILPLVITAKKMLHVDIECDSGMR